MSTDQKQTEATLTHHLEAFGSKRVDWLVSDYTEASVLVTPNGTLHGLDEIRNFFTAFIDNMPTGFLDAFKMLKQEIVGETAYILWQSSPWVSLGTDTFLVKDNKIAVQTFAAYPLSEASN